MAVTILSIVEKPLDWQIRGLSYTASGYGKKIPTSSVAVCSDGRNRRIYCDIYGNIGTAYIIVDGAPVLESQWRRADDKGIAV